MLSFAQVRVWSPPSLEVIFFVDEEMVEQEERGTRNGFGSLGNWRSLIPWPWPQVFAIAFYLIAQLSFLFARLLVCYCFFSVVVCCCYTCF